MASHHASIATSIHCIVPLLVPAADYPNRDHKCEHCGEKGTYSHITQVHDKNILLPCPNKCTKTMPRQDIEELEPIKKYPLIIYCGVPFDSPTLGHE